MTKEELKALMDEYGVEDVQQACTYINFVCDLLYAQKIETKKLYPYATKVIAELEKAEYLVFDLIEDVIYIMKDDNDDK